MPAKTKISQETETPPVAVVENTPRVVPNGAPTLIKSSQDLAAWEIEEIEKAKQEQQAEKEPEEESPLSALEREIERITPAEAEEILANILEFGGRLPFTVKRRGGEEEETLYCRLPERGEGRDCER